MKLYVKLLYKYTHFKYRIIFYIITLINIKDSYKLLNPIIIIMYNVVKYYRMFNIKWMVKF